MLIVLCVVASASARPIGLTDVVGAYHGKLAWSGCLTQEVASSTVVVDSIDGALAIDASSVRPQLYAVALVVSERGLVGRQATTTIELAAATAGSLELEIEIDSRCRARARMHRVSSGIRDCDRLVALARVEAKCSQLDSRSEDLATLFATTWKPSDAASCSRRAEQLESKLRRASCVPGPPAPSVPAHPRDCLEAARIARKFSGCWPRWGQRYVAEVSDLQTKFDAAEADAVPAIEARCREISTQLQAWAGSDCKGVVSVSRPTDSRSGS